MSPARRGVRELYWQHSSSAPKCGYFRHFGQIAPPPEFGVCLVETGRLPFGLLSLGVGCWALALHERSTGAELLSLAAGYFVMWLFMRRWVLRPSTERNG